MQRLNKLALFEGEFANLKAAETRVEKDSTNSSIPPTKQPIAKQIVLRTTSLRKPSGKKAGGQKGNKGHTLALCSIVLPGQ